MQHKRIIYFKTNLKTYGLIRGLYLNIRLCLLKLYLNLKLYFLSNKPTRRGCYD